MQGLLGEICGKIKKYNSLNNEFIQEDTIIGTFLKYALHNIKN